MKKIIIGILCILCLCSCTNMKDNSNTPLNTKYLEQEITLNLDKIMEVTNPTSSNTYDYTQNEYYDNIVKLGECAVPVLESMYKNNKLSGVSAYLSALIVQDITGCNLNERYNLDWSTAEEFYNLWQDNNCQFK